MSDPAQTPPEENAQAPEATASTAPPDEATAQSVEIKGQKYPVEEVLAWRDKGLMLKDYKKKTAEVADRRRDLETRESALSERERALEERLANLEGRARDQDDPFRSLDDTIPGLGQVGRTVAELKNELTEVKASLQRSKAESDRILADADREDAWDRLLGNFGPGTKWAFADAAKIREIAEKRGWAPSAQAVEDAFMLAYGDEIGAAKARANLARQTPRPMQAGELAGMPAATAAQVPARPAKPMRETSMEELVAQAIADPRKPRVEWD